MSEVKAFVTILGSAVIGTVVDQTELYYKLENAFTLNVNAIDENDHSKGIIPGFGPLALFNKGVMKDGLNFNLQRAHVFAEYDPSEELAELYNKIIGRIQLADASTLVSLDAARNKKK